MSCIVYLAISPSKYKTWVLRAIIGHTMKYGIRNVLKCCFSSFYLEVETNCKTVLLPILKIPAVVFQNSD